MVESVEAWLDEAAFSSVEGGGSEALRLKNMARMLLRLPNILVFAGLSRGLESQWWQKRLKE